MIRISLPFIFTLASELKPLGMSPDGDVKYGSVWFLLFGAAQSVNALANGSLFSRYLGTSYQLSQQLLGAIKIQTERQPVDFERQLGPGDLWTIKNLYSQYRTALLAELGYLNSYFVTQKGGYDMYSLLASGEALFPADLSVKVPEAITDAREAAKALAFEVPTACGFHVFRVTESVLRRYYAHETGGKAPPKVRNIGVYLNALKQANKGDEKILSALKQMTDLHRNPLIHPEVVLSTDEAIGALGIARSVITAMLAALPVPPPTTTTQAVAASPAIGPS